MKENSFSLVDQTVSLLFGSPCDNSSLKRSRIQKCLSIPGMFERQEDNQINVEKRVEKEMKRPPLASSSSIPSIIFLFYRYHHSLTLWLFPSSGVHCSRSYRKKIFSSRPFACTHRGSIESTTIWWKQSR